MTIVNNLNELAHDVLRDMDFDLETLEPSEYPVEESLTASISIDGAWRGVLALSVPKRFARTFSARWLGLSEDDVSEDVALDSFGELMNTMGGHFKARFCGKGELGLPIVSRDGDAPEPPEGAEEALVAHFKCEGFPVRFSVSVRAS